MASATVTRREKIAEDLQRVQASGWRLYVDDMPVEPLTVDTYLKALGPDVLWRGTYIIRHVRWEQDET
jgi:hypothetical protein